jgi:adhesin HecA-like repeat protein
MPRDVIITPASGLVDFKDDAGNIDAKVQIDTVGNLTISNSGGNLTIGDSSATVYIGDGINSTDIVFEQNGSVRAVSGKTLTLGASGSLITVASATSMTSTVSTTGLLTAAGGITVTGGSNTAGHFYSGTTNPSGTTRLNYSGYFYPTFINLIASGDTTTAASHYIVETGSDGFLRPKTLANTKIELIGNANTTFTGPTAARTYTLPDATTGLAGTGVSNTFTDVQGIISTNNQLLLKASTASNPTAIFRNDGTDFYILLSAASTALNGTWNTLRPLIINATTGALTSSNGQSFAGGMSTSAQITSTVATGTAPLVVASTTRVSNLNVATAGTADTFTTARTINGVSFNGSANINIPDLRGTNGTTTLATTGVTSGVNYLTTTNSIAGSAVGISTAGTDTNIGLTITTKGTGTITIDTGTGAGFIDLKPGADSIRFYDDDSSHYYRLVTGNTTANYDITLPAGNVTLTAGTSVVTTRSISTTSPLAGGGDLSANRTLSLAAGYGDTQNPYASKTANNFLAAPNGTAGVPTFRAIVAADIPTLNQNTTGSAATLTTARTINGVSFNGSANISVPDLRGTNGTTTLATTGVTSGVNYLTTTNSATGVAVGISTAGTDTNIGLTIATKGTGAITIDTGTGAGQIDLKSGSSNVRIWDDNSSHYYQFVTGDRTANYDVTLPAGNVTLTAGTTVVTDATNQTIAGTKTFSGILAATNQILTGGPNAFIRDYASGYNTNHVANTIYEIGRFTIAGNFENINIIGEIRAGSGSAVGFSKFVLNIRADTLPSKTFSLQEQYTSYGNDTRVKVYHNTASGLVVVGYLSTAASQNAGWNIRVQERANYNYFTQVTALTALVTTGLTEVVASASTSTDSAIISAPSYISSVATGTAPLVVASTTRVSNLNVATAGTADLLDGVSPLTRSASHRANRNISGGGTITVDASHNVLWSARFIVISNGRGSYFSTTGYFDINCPTSGTVTGVGGATNKTATAAGIPLAAWEALYYILPIGSNNASVAANFRVASYTADLNVPHDWVLICVRNGDNGAVTFNNGITLSAGQSLSAVQQSNTNTGNTLVRRDASGNFSAGTVTAALSGNATTATTLQTTRAINGVNFNGSAAISVPDLRGTNGTTTLATTGVTSGVNYLTTTNSATGGAVGISTAGSDANIGLTITTKGTGSIILDTGTSTGDVEIKPGSSNFRLYDDDSSHYYRFVTGNTTANYDVTLPAGSVTLTAGTTVVTTRSISTTAPLAGGGDLSANRTLSLAAGYGDTQNPYASKTANNFLAAPNGTAGVPTFRAIVAADIPTLNQNTTGSAATLTTTRTLWGQNFNGSTNVTGNLTSVGNITGTGAVTLTATSGTLALAATGANIVTASTNGTERMRITSAGDVLVGNTVESATGLVLGQDRNVAWAEATGTSYPNIFRQASSAALTLGWGVRYSSTANAFTSSIGASVGKSAITVGNLAIRFYVNSESTVSAGTNVTLTERMNINNAGTLSVTGDVVANTASDSRLKTDIKPISNALDKVSKISGVEFYWNSEAQKIYPERIHQDVGVIAQEVQEVMPEIVSERDNGYLAVKYEKLVPLLIEAIKELIGKCETLESKILTLESKFSLK